MLGEVFRCGGGGNANPRSPDHLALTGANPDGVTDRFRRAVLRAAMLVRNLSLS